MKLTKLEFSLMIGLLAALLWCAFEPHIVTHWWSAAFEPLCDGILTTGTHGENVVLKSKLAEWLCSLWG